MIGILTGCAVPFPVYTISTNNVSAIRNADRQIEVGEFQGGPSSVSCRLQPISQDGGKTFAKYIQDAFKDEIIVANAWALPTVKVTGVVKSVDVDCAIAVMQNAVFGCRSQPKAQIAAFFGGINAYVHT